VAKPTFAATLLQKIDMSDFENANSPLVSPRPLRTWDFMETTFVALIAYGVFIFASEFFFNIISDVYDGRKTLSPAQLQTWAVQQGLESAALILASLPAIAVLCIAIRMARREFAEYLALNWPNPGELGRALAIMAIVLMVESLVVAGTKNAPVDPYLRAAGASALLIYLISACIVSPMMEEFLVRGFMFRGWSQSFLGPIGAILLTSVVWTMVHTQRDWFARFCIFITGVLLGYFRWRSNSTWLAVMVHSAINIFVFFIWTLLYA
jgi:membrane protease YdiL (CAAX protease family)